MEETFICHVKGFGKDQNGMEKVLWLTKSQVDKVVSMRNDLEKASKLVGVGSLIFSPKDIAYIEKCKREWADAPKYFKERRIEEINRLKDNITITLPEGKTDEQYAKPIAAGPNILLEESADRMADYRLRREDFINRHLDEIRGDGGESTGEEAQ